MSGASPNALKIIILGGGIAGLTTALALTKFAPKDAVPSIHIYEIRPEPGTFGGAVNLTPNALRMLDHLGAFEVYKERGYGKTIEELEVYDLHSGTKLAVSSFAGPDGNGIGNPPYKALRITRGEALEGVLAVIEQNKNITMTCGKRTVDIQETADSVTIKFEDGESATADLLMGCDGIHSVTRLKHVEPERTATYTGCANAFGFAPKDSSIPPVHFDCTAMNFARRGMLLTSYHSPAADSVYVGGIMEVPDVGSRDGWKARGAEADKTREMLLERFQDAKIPCVKPLIEKAKDFFLWPIYTLSKEGKWHTERVMLLGDAAHAMPPQGESTGIVFEDTVLFSRCLTRWIEKGKPGPMSEAFEAYERLRRPRIDNAFEESKAVIRTAQDAGWLGHTIKTYIVPWFLWYTRAKREKHFVEDVTTSELNY